MKKNLRYLTIIVSIIATYFSAVYFAVAALLPELALPAGLVAVIFALLVYRFLGLTSGDEEGLPFGLLILLPFACITAGMIWWIMRLLGVWEIR